MSKLEKYPKYKDSEVEWIGKIPEEWEITRLANIGNFSASGIDKHIKKNEPKVKIVNFTDIYSNTNSILDSSIKYMVVSTPKENKIKNLLQKGDLVFLPSSETYEDLGLSALVNEELDNTSFSYHVIRFQFQYDIEHSFKKYLTNNHSVLSHFIREGKGTTRKIIGRNVFRNALVLLPPKQEQIKIANYLDQKTAQIDKTINLKEQMIDRLKERRQILINDVVTKGLDKTVKMKDSGVEWIGKVPEHWEVKKLKYIFKEINDRSETGEEELLSLSKYQGVIPKSSLEERAGMAKTLVGYKKVYQNNLVINKMQAVNGLLAVSKIEGITSPDYSVYRTISDKYNIDYYGSLLNQSMYLSEFKKVVTGVMEGFIRLYTDDLYNISVQVPPKEEQKKIVEYIEEQTKKIDHIVTLQQKQIKKLKEYKATLIDSAVTGKVRIA